MSPPPKFCDDFEHDLPTNGAVGWSATSTFADGSVTIDTSDSVSPTRSLSCATPANPTVKPIANLYRFFANAMSDVWIRFDWKIDSGPKTGQLAIDVLRLGPSPDGSTLNFQFDIGADQSRFTEADHRESPTGTFYTHALGGAVQFGVWQYVQVHLTLGASPRMSVTIDTNTVVDENIKAPNIVPSPGTLYAGIFYSASGAAQTVHIDNITLDY
jgi:hypothetical protein